ncbi:MAG: flagellar hook-basal body complex protein [Phaeospirillum sp.]|nr:flagellar hook-basal body complex protein [Phaeospirillum sp.]
MLWGALTNAGQAMQTMSVAMGGISDNVANVNTTGYKKVDTQFKTVLSESIRSGGVAQNSVTNASASSGLNIFSVMAASRNLISKQGTIATSDNWTDLAINGRGFFVVSHPDDAGLPQSKSITDASTLFTRAGAFQQKAVGTKSYFTTADGNYLMGMMADAQGNIPGVATSAHSTISSSTGAASAAGGSSSLTAIYTQPGQLIDGIATTAMRTGMNLPADAVATASPQTFVNTTAITDSTGGTQDLTMTWTRVDGDNWSVGFSLPTTPASGSIGAITGSPMTVTMDAFGAITSPNTSVSGTGYGDLVIDWSVGGIPASTTTPSVDLNTQKPVLKEVSVTLTVYDNAFNAETLPVAFERYGNDKWYMRLKVPSTAGTVTALSSGSAAAGGAAVPSSIPITFDGSGSIISPTSLDFGVKWTPSVTATKPAVVPVPASLAPYATSIATAVATVTAPSLPATAAQLTAYGTGLINAGNAYLAANPVFAADPVLVADLNTYGTNLVTALTTASTATSAAMATAATKAGTNTVALDTSKLTQFVGTSPTVVEIKNIEQDGYESGIMDSSSFANTGELIAHFSNGRTRTLAMLSVASFVAPDSLDPLSGTVFRYTQQAGKVTVGTIADQGSGAQIVASAVETSNVDLADEFTKMIITQKAYSMNSKVFTTADEMFQTARDLYR